MSKKEFYETYIKDNRTEDEKMMDIIHENARKHKNDITHVQGKKNKNKGHIWLSRAVMFSDLVIIALLITLVVMICTK